MQYVTFPYPKHFQWFSYFEVSRVLYIPKQSQGGQEHPCTRREEEHPADGGLFWCVCGAFESISGSYRASRETHSLIMNVKKQYYTMLINLFLVWGA